ncbi:twinfilin-1-like [Anneissia japonica]|uniref:twinfilin-1-like n=1 Tax=Anneissia japonica TaxID=1529436 RepID=UPI0014257F52|nr:twinfilin-1-like [Anneissia japonica]
MSHQTGITASQELKNFFASSKADENVRAIKVKIDSEKESMEVAESFNVRGTWEDDYDNAVLPMLKDKESCYIIFRLDTKNDLGFEWIFILYVPDFCQVRDKMLYASTKSSLKTEFGSAQIKQELYGTSPDDVSLSGYHKHLEAEEAPAPLTAAEEDRKFMRENESFQTIGVDTKHQTMQGVNFPLSNDATKQLKRLSKEETSYIQLSLDVENEEIHLGEYADDLSANEIASHVPPASPRYHLFLFKHTHEGDFMKSVVFIYSMPGYKCSVKERMLYSTCKAPFLSRIAGEFNIEVAKSIEVDDASELTEDFIYQEVHPVRNLHRPTFAKPKGPAGKRGVRRLIKE